MKKKLEAELISIAHRILKLKNKSDVIQLHQEAQKLYETLSILRFAEENLADAKPTIGREEVVALLEESFENETVSEPEEKKDAVEVVSALADEKEPEQIVAEAEEEKPEEDEEQEEEKIEEPQPEEDETVPQKEEIQEPKEEPAIKTDEVKADDIFKPAFEWVFEPKEPETPKAEEPEQTESAETKEKLAQAEIAFEDLLGPGYKDPVFVKSDEVNVPEPKKEDPADVIPINRTADKVQVIQMSNSEIAARTVSLNDRLSRGITVGLNDRIAFVKHLFNNSNEDYNRVLSQLITFDTLDEAREFIDTMVKPDYNNWEGKDEYSARFMEIIEKKFA